MEIRTQPRHESAHPIRIGCAGWSIGSAHRRCFGGDGTALERYASRLDAVELNSSFYGAHQPATYARWAASVPQAFRFSVKVPKAITHERGLLGTAPLVDRFLGECLQLGDKLGGLLVQLPPSLVFEGRRANAFFAVLRRRLPEGVAIACEPRHPSWFGEQALPIWNRHAVNRLAADPVPVAMASAMDPGTEGQWCYWRLHGSPRTYYSAYQPEFLAHLATRLKQAAALKPVWVIFDNTAAGHAIANALELKKLMGKGVKPTEASA